MNLLQKAQRTHIYTKQRALFSNLMPNLTMAREESKHRMKLPLYDLEPRTEQCFVAPNSTVGKFTLI
jgi:hypothetical protein